MENTQTLFPQLDNLYNEHLFFFGLVLKIIFSSLKYLNIDYSYRLGWVCVLTPLPRLTDFDICAD
jgi:hypothetical protein